MKNALITALAVVILVPCLSHAQVGGNASYGQAGAKDRTEQNERSKRTLSPQEIPPSAGSTFIEASVLMNVKADEYVALFAVAEEAPTVAECSQKLDVTVKDFTTRLKALGVTEKDLNLDFIAQNKIYDFDVVGDIAKEKLSGFELKKNIAIRYKNPALLDKFLVAAAQSQIYDLVKVDYVVKDTNRVQNQLREEAARIIQQKAAHYKKLLGLNLSTPSQIYVERPAIYYPANLYDSYTAYEAETMSSNFYRQKYTVQSARKTRTFYFNGLDGDGFDKVINPVVIEPMVQFTLYLKVKYDTARPTPTKTSITARRKI